MRNYLTISIINFLIIPAIGQVIYHSDFEENAFKSHDPIKIIMASDPETDQAKYVQIQTEINELLEKLHKKEIKFSNKEDFLEWTFYYVHRKKLGWYEKYVSLNDLLEHKKYDCLTGTILYSIILKDFNIPFTVHEFDYHIFLVINLPDQDILIEATDPLNGFVKDVKQIQSRLNKYLISTSNNGSENQQGIGEKQSALYGNRSTMGSVDLLKLAGLQYFNLSIKAYNDHNYEKAIQYITKAEILYPSIRMISTKKSMLSSL